MTIRTEQTLRRMWDESLKLATDSNGLAAEAARSASDAEAAELIAETHRKAEMGTRSVSNAMMLEAADLADLVNRERQDAGLTLLKPGDAYPVDPPAADDGVTVTPTPTLTDGQLDAGEVAGNA